MRILGQGRIDLLEVLVKHRVATDHLREVGEFLLGREDSVDEQVADFDEGGLGRQFFDGNASVA